MKTYVFMIYKKRTYTKPKPKELGVVKMLNAELIGKVIQRKREQKKLSQEVISGLAGIGRTHLSAIERGERKPTLETFFKIAEALNIRPSTLLAEIENELENK